MYGGFGYEVGNAGGCGANNYGGWGIRWIYALLLLIVIVLQFGRKDVPKIASASGCDGSVVVVGDNQLIDRSVLFIIVVFLLVLCGGCWTGGQSNYGAAGGFGYGY